MPERALLWSAAACSRLVSFLHGRTRTKRQQAAALQIALLAFLAVTLRAELPPGAVQVMFLPPPSEASAVYSVGVYETKTGRLARRLHEDAEDDAFTAGLNGFITSWDRKDDTGRTVPAGRYAARGWAVGEMKVEGVDILGNDWAEGDEGMRIRHVEAICAAPGDNSLAVLATMADDGVELLRFDGGEDAKLLWRVVNLAPGSVPPNPSRTWRLHDEGENLAVERHGGERSGDYRGQSYAWKDGSQRSGFVGKSNMRDPRSAPVAGREGTVWSVLDGTVTQTAANGMVLRSLGSVPGQPTPRAVSASLGSNRVYLLEELPGWQRVRGLEWAETKQEAGQPVSEWKTFFERNTRRPDPALGLDEKAPSPVVELPLAKNPLEPGKPQRAQLRAGFDATGSYLETADGLRLLPISARPNLRAARLARDPKAPDRLLFYQFDGAAWDVFSVTGASRALVSFDAGEFELTADGERRPEPPTDEPRDP